MRHTNEISSSQNPFAPETAAMSGPAPTERTANPAGSGASVLAAGDHAKLSGFGGALAQALSTSDIRMDKVTALRQAIAAGTYNISALDVADKIIHSLLIERRTRSGGRELRFARSQPKQMRRLQSLFDSTQ